MKQKINLIISSVSLAVTSTLLILVMFAWYATNKVAYVNGGTGSTATYGCDVELQRGSYHSGDNPYFEWIDSENLAFTNISPGNQFYFRMKITYGSGVKQDYASITFDGLDSKLVDGKLTVSNGYVCKLDGSYTLPLYAISNNQVVVSDKATSENKVLYTISGTTISLNECKIQNVFEFYNLGTTEPTSKDLSGKTSTPLNSVTNYKVQIDKNTEQWFYFVLEFNEEDSLTTYNGLESSNAYLYQQLLIDHITISMTD